MKLGVMDYVIAAEGYDAMARAAAALGFHGIEASLTRQQLQDPQAARLRELQDIKQTTGLSIPSVCLGEYSGLLVKPAPSEATMAEFERAIHWAAELEAGVVLIPFFFEGELKTEADFDSAVKGFRRLCKVAEPLGIAVCYEGTYPGEQFVQLAEAVGSSAFGVYFDLANLYWLGMHGPTEIRKHGRYIRQVHMKETRVGPGDCHPGEGRVDYAESARALKEVGYEGWLVFETPKARPEVVAQDIAFTKRFFEVD